LLKISKKNNMPTNKRVKKINAQLTKITRVVEKYEKAFAQAGGATAEEQQLIDLLHKKIQRGYQQVTELEPEVSTPEDFASNPGVSDDTVDNKVAYEYNKIVADLFKKGSGDDHKIHPNDVRQGYLGDCYFLSAIQAIAQSDPSALEKLIKSNGDGTYEVTLYVYKTFISWNRSPVKITVDTSVPTSPGTTNPIYAGKGDNELWVLLLEKAYAQYEGDYGDIEGGNPSKAMGVLLSEDGTDINIKKLSNKDLKAKITAALENDKAITASSNSKTEKKESVTVDGQIIWYSHAYNLYSLNGDKVYLQNPHGRNDVELNMTDFKTYYRKISVQQ
jgi:hypothetical protein